MCILINLQPTSPPPPDKEVIRQDQEEVETSTDTVLQTSDEHVSIDSIAFLSVTLDSAGLQVCRPTVGYSIQ